MAATLERVAARVRHAPALERLVPLWKLLGPAYDLAVAWGFRRRGLPRLVNGSELVRLDLRARRVHADYEPPYGRSS